MSYIVSSFRFTLIPLVSVHCHYKYFNSFSAGTVFRRQKGFISTNHICLNTSYLCYGSTTFKHILLFQCGIDFRRQNVIFSSIKTPPALKGLIHCLLCHFTCLFILSFNVYSSRIGCWPISSFLALFAGDCLLMLTLSRLKLCCLFFHSLEVLSRCRDPQLHVG